jgi:hypothetical protein
MGDDPWLSGGLFPRGDLQTPECWRFARVNTKALIIEHC